jgi:hypothetical protein
MRILVAGFSYKINQLKRAIVARYVVKLRAPTGLGGTNLCSVKSNLALASGLK